MNFYRVSFCLALAMMFFLPQSWADGRLDLMQTVHTKLSKQWEARLETEEKWRGDMSKYYDFEWMPWVGYNFTNWFKVGAGYRQLHSLPKHSTDWQIERRPLVDLVLKKELYSWGLEERLRTEYRFIKYQEGYIRFRNRIKLFAPAWTKAEIRPWTGWESYWTTDPKWRSDHWYQNRIYTGVVARLSKHLKVNCYYYLEKTLRNGGGREYNNELGFDINIAFDELWKSVKG
jgi:hypothetical protein